MEVRWGWGQARHGGSWPLCAGRTGKQREQHLQPSVQEKAQSEVAGVQLHAAPRHLRDGVVKSPIKSLLSPQEREDKPPLLTFFFPTWGKLKCVWKPDRNQMFLQGYPPSGYFSKNHWKHNCVMALCVTIITSFICYLPYSSSSPLRAVGDPTFDKCFWNSFKIWSERPISVQTSLTDIPNRAEGWPVDQEQLKIFWLEIAGE